MISVLLAFLGFLSVALGAVSKPSTYRPTFRACFFVQKLKKSIYEVIPCTCNINDAALPAILVNKVRRSIYSCYNDFIPILFKLFLGIFMDWLFIQISGETVELSQRDRTALVPVHLKIVTGSMKHKPAYPLSCIK